MRVQQVELPGIGVRHDLAAAAAAAGRRIGVVSYRSGKRELVLFDDEAEALADILGASLMLGQLAGLGRSIPPAGRRRSGVRVTAGRTRAVRSA